MADCRAGGGIWSRAAANAAGSFHAGRNVGMPNISTPISRW